MHFNDENGIEGQITIYIEEARSWYAQKHLRQSIDFWHYITLVLIVTISMFFILSISNFSQNIVQLPFPLYVNNDGDEHHYIKSLSQKKQTIEESFARYMVERYVVLRESYSPQMLEISEWESLLSNINGLSSYKTFDEYLSFILPNRNYDSPIIHYRFNTKVYIQINNIKIVRFIDKKPVAAEVYFTSMKCKNNRENCTTAKYLSFLEFDMYNFNMHSIHMQNFKFRISSYKKV